ncbi:hypothetical protein B0H63DRAFT_534786 [Podospora didyma]|uniref:Uncharacterized protein n=1 Tax=Podospora didyma TaxID=330526 RepID=A0AAE0K2R5_9PEZI|nr:hypothetical protein B0H63DRAFT_534786 [Podospora didyma]
MRGMIPFRIQHLTQRQYSTPSETRETIDMFWCGREEGGDAHTEMERRDEGCFGHATARHGRGHITLEEYFERLVDHIRRGGARHTWDTSNSNISHVLQVDLIAGAFKLRMLRRNLGEISHAEGEQLKASCILVYRQSDPTERPRQKTKPALTSSAWRPCPADRDLTQGDFSALSLHAAEPRARVAAVDGLAERGSRGMAALPPPADYQHVRTATRLHFPSTLAALSARDVVPAAVIISRFLSTARFAKGGPFIAVGAEKARTRLDRFTGECVLVVPEMLLKQGLVVEGKLAEYGWEPGLRIEEQLQDTGYRARGR